MKKSVAAVLTAGIMAAGVISSGLTVFAEDRGENPQRYLQSSMTEQQREMPPNSSSYADMKGMTSH